MVLRDSRIEVGHLEWLAELRERFEANRSNITILEALNEALRAETSDEAADLQCDVMLAILALRPAKAVARPPGGPGVLTGVLADCGLAKADGRPLHRYRVSDVRFGQLKAEIEKLPREYGAHGLVAHGGPVFVLYCAEWFRREYQGGHYAWRMPYPEIFGSLSPAETKMLTQGGLKWWGLKPRRSGSLELRLQSLILEGGFPTRLLESREHGRIATHLRGLLARLEARSDPTDEDALALSRASLTNLGPFDHEGFHLLCAELALAILALRRLVHSKAPPGVSASVWLDAAQSGWRGELPISLSGDGATRLLDDLVSARMERLASDAVCQRLLIRSETGWEPAVGIGVSGEVSIPINAADPSVGRMRAFAAGELSNVLAGELAMLEPPTEAGEHWLCRPRGGSRHRAPFDFAQPVAVELRGGDAAPIPFVWPKGGPRRSELLVFADDRGDEVSTEPDELVLIGTGSMSTRRHHVYLWAPRDFAVTHKEGGMAVAPLWEGQRRLFEVTASVYAGTSEGDRYRVEVGADQDKVEQLDLRGTPFRGAEVKDRRVEMFAGRPELHVRTGDRGQSAKAGEVQWRRLPAGQWKDWAGQPPQVGEGLVEVVWRDPVANVKRDRRVVAILPDGAEVLARPSGPLGVEYELREMAGWTLRPADRAIASEATETGLIIRFEAKPLRRLEVALAKLGSEPIAIVARTRLKNGGFARVDGSLFKTHDHVMLDDLRGSVAFADGRDRVYFRNSSGDKAHFAFTDELALWSLSEDILRLLAGGGDLDHTVLAELGQAEGRRLKIGRYAAQVMLVGREVSITDEPVPADNATIRSLEWFPILRPAAQVLDRRSWSERLLEPTWTLPDDLEGPGLVLLREGDRVIGRPTLFVGHSPREVGGLCRLQHAALVDTFFARQSAIDEALDGLADATPAAAADRAYLLSLVTALDGIPAAALNMLERLSANTVAQAALMAAALDESTQGKIWKLDRELPLMWALIPFEDWARAFDAQSVELRAALAAGLFVGDQADLMVKDTIKVRARSLVSLEPMLSLPLMSYTHTGGQGLNRSLAEAAQDRLRRSGDQSAAATNATDTQIDPARASCFRAIDSLVRDRLPATWPFHTGQWEGLDAACAAAIAAAGLARLEPRHIQRIRAAEAQEPLSFADLFAAAFLSLAQGRALAC
ncbi:MAG TPA: STY4851/ECs_5259 family protein [Caulobacteraceae bacterium]